MTHMDAMGRKNLWCSKAKRKEDAQVSICNAIYLKKKRLVEPAAGWWGRGDVRTSIMCWETNFLPAQLLFLGLVGYTLLKYI